MLKTNRKISPFRTIFFVYAGMMFLFSWILYMPVSHVGNLSYIDALFVSSSALSVTGLSPIDISTQLTTFGQVVLLLEFQIGGIGIMAFLTYLLFFFGKSVSLSQTLLFSADQNQIGLKSIKHFMRNILLITFFIEGLAFVLLYPSIASEYDSSGKAIFYTAFHSVSSFTNAGFDLFGNSLIDFQEKPVFLLTSAFLLILGVLGFPLIFDLLNIKKKKKTLYTKVNLVVHSILLLIGFVVFSVAEWQKTFDHLDFFDKLSNAFFLSATARNGGLTTVDIGTLSNTTFLLLALLMFIGGSSGSVGGGMRTSTFAVIFAKLLAICTGREEATLFKKSIPSKTVEKSFVIFFSLFAVFFTSTLVVSFIEPLSLKAISFEVLSALTTTGLSTGITPDLSALTKFILALLMLVGRIGIMTAIYLLIKEKTTKTKYIKEDIIVG